MGASHANKHVSPLQAFDMRMIDVDAEHVKNYAATHAASNSDRDDLPEGGNDAAKPSAGEPQVPEPDAAVPWNPALQTVTSGMSLKLQFCLGVPKSSALEKNNQ